MPPSPPFHIQACLRGLSARVTPGAGALARGVQGGAAAGGQLRWEPPHGSEEETGPCPMLLRSCRVVVAGFCLRRNSAIVQG
eukprot:scaffold149_cov146-Isochrysis_galbana.AAC.2